MLRRFLLTLLSSWIVNPLGILVAQWFGVANASVVILVLLATGACVPFQLLMNECISATAASGQSHASRGQLGLLLTIQSAACAVTVSTLAVQHFPTAQIAIVVGALAINTGLSYRISLRYYRMVTEGIISMRAAVVVGIIPGVTSLLLYLAYCLVTQYDPQIAAAFIIASTVVPSVAQWRYLQTNAKPCIDQSVTPSFDVRRRPAIGWLFGTTLALAALSAGSTHLREMVAQLSADHVALLLVALNSMLSLVNTSTRAAFLNRSGDSQQKPLAMAVAAMAGAGASAVWLGWWVAPLLALIAAQLSIAWVIEAARRMPATSA
jgi:hypothetical protein